MNGGLATPAAAESSDEASNDEARRSLIEQLLGEVTAWSPRDRASAFKRWHMGSLSIVHLSLLSVLEARGAQPMGVLADELDVSVASATGIVDRMEKRGLVERQHVAEDRRVVLVRPTERGLKLVRMVGDHRRARFAMAMRRLDETQLTALLSVLRTVRAAIAEDSANDEGSDRPLEDELELDDARPAEAGVER
jgi:DNA-binding MarR family transcriptional regulator